MADVYAHVYAHTAAAENNKESMLIEQMGSFFYVHALACISMKTGSQLWVITCLFREHTHLWNPFWHFASFTNMKDCSSAGCYDTMVWFTTFPLHTVFCKDSSAFWFLIWTAENIKITHLFSMRLKHAFNLLSSTNSLSSQIIWHK